MSDATVPARVRAGFPGRVPWMAIVAVALVAVLAGFGLLLHGAQRDGRRAAERRFEERAQVSAALTESVFSALGASSGPELARRLGGSAREVRAYLRKQLKSSRLIYMAVVDERGDRVAAAGTLPSRFAVGEAGRPGPALSDVRSSTAGPVLEFAIRFKSAQGPRLLVEGLPLGLMRAFLNDFLARLPNPDRSALLMRDGNGATLARGGVRQQVPPEERMTVHAAVPNTRWRLHLVADRARVVAGIDRMPWVGWTLLAALGLATLAGACLYRRVVLSSRRQRTAHLALLESQEQQHALVDALEEAVFLMTADRVHLLNAAAKQLLDTDAEVMEAEDFDFNLLAEDGTRLADEDTPVMRALTTGIPQRQVLALERPDGSRTWIDVSARPLVRPGEDTPHAVVTSCSDVTQRRELEIHLTDLADRDPLTTLWNRRRFEHDVAHQLARCGRYDEVATLLMLDIDGFKQVNDTLGHLTGDDVLRAVADALRERLRSTDSAARLGGDEFAVLLIGVGETEARHVAADLEKRLTKAARTVQDDIALSLSIGFATLDRSTESVADAIAAADHAMYATKQHALRSAAGAGDGSAVQVSAAAAELMPTLEALRALTRADVAWVARPGATGLVAESVVDAGDSVGVAPGSMLTEEGGPPQAKAFLSLAIADESGAAYASLGVARRSGAEPFTDVERELAQALVPVAGEQLRRDGVLRAGNELASLRALLAAVNARDSYTGGHSRQVVTLARAVAARLGLDDAAINEVEHVALLHDLGKIAVPDAILRKRGPLTEHEQLLMRQHPVVGGEIVASVPELAHLAPAIRAEHERWDGAGYPDGLAGEAIPIASRITFVCDAYHAMTSHRPYRRAMSPARARDEIERSAGTQFCPMGAAALLEVLAVREDLVVAAA